MVTELDARIGNAVVLVDNLKQGALARQREGQATRWDVDALQQVLDELMQVREQVRVLQADGLRPSEGRTLTLVVPLLPSKKNNVVVRRAKRKRDTKHGPEGSVYHYAGKADDVKTHERAIRSAVQRAVGGVGPLFPLSTDVLIDVVWHVPDNRLRVTVRGLAPLGGPVARERDVPNLADTLCDALEGAAYVNDAQVAGLRVWKTYVPLPAKADRPSARPAITTSRGGS